MAANFKSTRFRSSCRIQQYHIKTHLDGMFDNLTGLCSYFIAKSVTEFLLFEVKTQIKEIHAEQVPFPQISICNANPLVTQAANDYIKNFLLNTYNISVSNYSDLLNKQSLYPNLNNVLNYIQYMSNDPSLNESVKRTFGYGLTFSCMFNSNIYCEDGQNTVWYFHPKYGNCFNFNPLKTANGTKREIYKAYRSNLGFSAAVFLGNPDEKFNYLYESDSSGAAIVVSDQETFALVPTGFFIRAGTFTKISVIRRETKNLPEPYGKCVEVENIDTILSREMTKLNLKYTRKNCLNLCEQKSNIDDIGCNSLQLPRIFGAPLCNNRTSYDLLKKYNRFNLSTCSDLCPIECNSIFHQTRLSFMDYPSYNIYTNVFKEIEKNNSYFRGLFDYKNVTYDTFRKSLAYFQVVYEQIKYTEVTVSPSKTWVDLVAAIGGTMGAFLGLSIMIFVEIIELIVEFIFVIYKNI